MIRKSLDRTKSATFSVQLPNAAARGFPSPTGTGFFISPDGFFITAAHVVSQDGLPNGPVRTDIADAWLKKESRPGFPGAMCCGISLVKVFPRIDIAILKIDFEANARNSWLQGRDEFPWLQVSFREMEDGEPAYSFGYPLGAMSIGGGDGIIIGEQSLCPRVTSAIISSTIDKTTMMMADTDPKVYVLDKALNYGNSGGPIMATESGCVHAVCSRFQSVDFTQPHLSNPQNPDDEVYVTVPSLYGIVSRLDNLELVETFNQLKIPVITV